MRHAAGANTGSASAMHTIGPAGMRKIKLRADFAAAKSTFEFCPSRRNTRDVFLRLRCLSHRGWRSSLTEFLLREPILPLLQILRQGSKLTNYKINTLARIRPLLLPCISLHSLYLLVACTNRTLTLLAKVSNLTDIQQLVQDEYTYVYSFLACLWNEFARVHSLILQMNILDRTQGGSQTYSLMHFTLSENSRNETWISIRRTWFVSTCQSWCHC